MTYEVEYYDADQRLHTVRIEATEEVLLPFKIKAQDRRFSKVKRARIIAPPPSQERPS